MSSFPSFVLVAEPDQAGLDYLCRHLTPEATLQVKALAGNSANSSKATYPALTSLEQAKANLGADAFSAIEARYRDALAYFIRFIPLLPNERLVSHAILALAESWNGFAKGMLAYRRETDAGTILYLLPSVNVSDAGVISHEQLPQKVVPIRLVAVPDWVNTAIGASSSIIQTVGMAVAATNPVGWVIVGGTQVMMELFYFFRREAPIPIDKIIAEAISVALQDLVVHESNAVIRTAYEWYTREYEKTYSSVHGEVTIDRQQFQRTLEDHIYDRSEFLKAVNRLYEADVRERALPLFVFATSIATLFFQTEHMLKTADLNRGNHGDKKKVDTSSLIDTKNYLQERMDEINPLFTDLERKTDEMLNGISVPNRRERQNCNDVNGRMVCSTNRYWEFSDGDKYFTYPDGKNDNGETKCRRDHASHVEAARTKFLYGKRDEIRKAITELNGTLAKLIQKSMA